MFFCTEPPPVIQVPNNVTVPPGDRAILTCLTMSTVRYNLTWHRDNRNVKLLEPLRMRMMSNLSLEIKTVKISDAGEFNCVASNEGGFTRASVFLKVQGKMKKGYTGFFKKIMQRCSFSVNATLIWFINSILITNIYLNLIIRINSYS